MVFRAGRVKFFGRHNFFINHHVPAISSQRGCLSCSDVPRGFLWTHGPWQREVPPLLPTAIPLAANLEVRHRPVVHDTEDKYVMHPGLGFDRANKEIPVEDPARAQDSFGIIFRQVAVEPRGHAFPAHFNNRSIASENVCRPPGSERGIDLYAANEPLAHAADEQLSYLQRML